MLSKIKVSDKVAVWITTVNNIIDGLKLAVAPSTDSEGNEIAGCDGLLSKEDKQIIDNLAGTYLPSEGGSPRITKTWKLLERHTGNNSFFVTYKDADAMVAHVTETCSVNAIYDGDEDVYAEKKILFVADSDVTLTLAGDEENVQKTVEIKSGQNLLTSVIFIDGKTFWQILSSE